MEKKSTIIQNFLYMNLFFSAKLNQNKLSFSFVFAFRLLQTLFSKALRNITMENFETKSHI